MGERPMRSKLRIKRAPRRWARERRVNGPHVPKPDPQVQRVREAGGPIDHAHYSCQCGYSFEAEVSTTVACPHCGDTQAW
jgi:hypothetical protein